ncbi:hypothetical protein NVIE_0817 [Nitrososphaera viennensis EN76]|uniref:Uncharacterized protein n=1 Tax=Nitrososphaera viennensis EN76 TaxID=926571 RepID=A0A060HI93_9ARCH|nr:hypothetical protein NVIE_0817 [Nitrososphaera viennensis EN76]
MDGNSRVTTLNHVIAKPSVRAFSWVTQTKENAILPVPGISRPDTMRVPGLTA